MPDLDLHGWANYAEAVLWWGIAAGFAIAWWRQCGQPEQRSVRRQAAIACATFFIFGITDVIEVQTGHWARPWWLFLLKTGCVLSMVILLVVHHRRTRGAHR